MFSTRDKILLAFEQAPRRAVSGADLAHRLGMTRASIWKHVKALRAEGFPIKTHQATGYAMTEPFDFSLLKGELVRGSRFWNAHYQFSTASTQTLAKNAAQQGAPEGHYWIVEKQTAGRGRLDRVWDSNLGGIWLSLLLRPAIPPMRVPALTLIAALCLAEAIRSKLHRPVKLKWPNDVVVETVGGWRKIAGILTEISAEIDRAKWVILGIGVNVNNPLPETLEKQATSLRKLSKRTYSRAELVKEFLERFAGAYRRFEKAGFDGFRQSYWHAYSRPNQAVELKTSQGLIKGIARGVDAQGALLVESKHKTFPVWEGEIVL